MEPNKKGVMKKLKTKNEIRRRSGPCQSLDDEDGIDSTSDFPRWRWAERPVV